MSAGTNQVKSCPIPTRVLTLKDWSQLPDCYSQTPGGTLFSTTPGGKKTAVFGVRCFSLETKLLRLLSLCVLRARQKTKKGGKVVLFFAENKFVCTNNQTSALAIGCARQQLMKVSDVTLISPNVSKQQQKRDQHGLGRWAKKRLIAASYVNEIAFPGKDFHIRN